MSEIKAALVAASGSEQPPPSLEEGRSAARLVAEQQHALPGRFR